MEILAFGNKEKKKIILLHGFQCPYQVWEDYIKYYEKDYHIIVPILQGHSVKNKEDFISYKDSVKQIEDYYISRYGYDVYVIFGMSMGGIIAANIWQSNMLNIKTIIFDGSPLVSYPTFQIDLIINVTLVRRFYLMERNVGIEPTPKDRKPCILPLN